MLRVRPFHGVPAGPPEEFISLYQVTAVLARSMELTEYVHTESVGIRLMDAFSRAFNGDWSEVSS